MNGGRFGEVAQDSISGGEGNDILDGGDAVDFIDGGPNLDCPEIIDNGQLGYSDDTDY